MPDKPLPTEQILAMLAAGPARIAAAAEALLTDQLRTPPAPDEWSANDVLAHLRACADMWGGAIARILAEDMPAIKAINPRTWIEKTDYLDLQFTPSLQAFTTQRTDLLAMLDPLPPDAWQRAATVSVAGKPLLRTVHFYAQWMATHERPHLKQIERIVATLSA